MHTIRQRVQNASFSVREIAEKADTMDDVIRLDIGQPVTAPPQSATAAAQTFINENIPQYTSLWGRMDLRDRIASFEQHKASIRGENVMVTNGGTGALFTTLTTICESGDAILANDPFWSVYPIITAASNVDLNHTSFFSNGEINIESIEESITPQTKAILINSPENPSGRVYTKEDLQALADIAEDNDIWLIGDEVYDRIVFDREHTSVAEVAPNNSIIVNSFSKNFSMTGWRVGWLFTQDTDLITELGKANRASIACPHAVSQEAALGALDDPDPYIDKMQKEYKERRDMTLELLEELGFNATRPEGSIYAFPNIGTDSWQAAHSLLEDAGVGVVPGAPSGESSNTNIRICFGSTSKSTLKRGLDKIRDWADKNL